MKQIQATVITYHELDKLVHTTWPERSDFECVAEFEWNNDEEHKCENVSEDDHDPIAFGDWLAKHKYSRVGEYQLLAALVEAGKLQPGNYIIEVSW